MSTKDRSRLDEEEVLLAFSVEPSHGRETLEQYLKEYPEHASALVDCSIELMMDAVGGTQAAATSEGAVDNAWRRFQAAVAEPADAPLVNPFSKLNPSAFKSVAKKLDVSNLFLIRLRDRAVSAASIPAQFVQGLAAELGATADAVAAYLRSPPAMVSGHSFRSSVKPEVAEQITFLQAIETSQLTPAQQATLKAMLD
ncbi:hypothetical protein [Polaromonas sp. A23]|uniref:hypothetical protein n=1 Tax=Polaromonas sp. A23 TaxID=1944133 RepID=UPI0009876FDF|nr:hypothetical protein [Polaromonas sp. A23]OOG36630.1 hypothetical protein B0B52_20205 [Polaromonas sp. A23]